MGRSRDALPAKSSTKSFEDMVQCELDHNDEHEVHPTTWPPPTGRGRGDGSMPLQCVRCHTNVIAYREHATGEMKGIKVVLPTESTPKPKNDMSAARAALAAKRAAQVA